MESQEHEHSHCGLIHPVRDTRSKHEIVVNQTTRLREAIVKHPLFPSKLVALHSQGIGRVSGPVVVLVGESDALSAQ